MNAPIPELLTRKGDMSEGTFQVSLMEDPLQCENTGMSVLQLLAALRKYHHQRDLSHQERHGSPDLQSRQALSELEAVQDSLKHMTSEDGILKAGVSIEASLNLKVSPIAA